MELLPWVELLELLLPMEPLGLEPLALEPEFKLLCGREVSLVEVPELLPEVLEGLVCKLLLSNWLLLVAELLLPGEPEAELVLALELEMELPCVLKEPEALVLLLLERSISVEVETLPEVEVSSVPLAEVDSAGAFAPEVLMEVLL